MENPLNQRTSSKRAHVSLQSMRCTHARAEGEEPKALRLLQARNLLRSFSGSGFGLSEPPTVLLSAIPSKECFSI